MKRIILIALLITLFGGCEIGRRVYNASTRRMVKFPTANMQPTINPSDRAEVDQSYYVNNPVERFDIVLLKHPEPNPAFEGADTVIVKRVIGLGGESVELRGGRVYINGKEIREPFAAVKDPEDYFGPITIPEGEYFFLGDNRPNSFDSRYWARPTVDKSYIQGKVIEIFPGG